MLPLLKSGNLISSRKKQLNPFQHFHTNIKQVVQLWLKINAGSPKGQKIGQKQLGKGKIRWHVFIILFKYAYSSTYIFSLIREKQTKTKK